MTATQTFPTAYATARAVAAGNWSRRSYLAPSDRFILAVDTIWAVGYTTGYRAGHHCVTRQVHTSARAAAPQTPAGEPRRCAAALVDAAAEVAERCTPLIAPTPAAILAAAEATTDPHPNPALSSCSSVVWTQALRAGALAGIATAATDILIDFRIGVGLRALGRVRVADLTAAEWAAAVLIDANRTAASTPWIAGATNPLKSSRRADPTRASKTTSMKGAL
ncbi:hypothetical protein [Asanoa siamensis]|uniref:Uncharacterized protein n=1 Tax=Asanoa siamensis TaxID=926357 RepID=A0ABQ4CSB9_9ACTN|nr:hypothetical protein [Asanoa siamensis]GIF74185.1 hypothetical protein Asi02nite_37030 [Asanoa siamensis]